jgi:hypothetical protein
VELVEKVWREDAGVSARDGARMINVVARNEARREIGEEAGDGVVVLNVA